MLLLQLRIWCVQLFDGKDGRPKYPKRWVMFPPLL
jgi:hypothetical protein